jgi:hypothetical protein
VSTKKAVATTSAAGLLTGAVGALLVASATAGEARNSIGLAYTQHGALITAQDAGAADAVATVAVSPGTAGQVLTVSDAGLPHWAAAPSSNSGLTITTYYADSFVAVAGSESASIAGTGPTAAITLGATATTRAYGTSGVTAPRAILTLPVGTRSVWVEIQSTGFTGSTTAGNRYLAVAIQNVGSGVPTALWGVAPSDATSACFVGNFLPGVNTAGNWSTNNGLPGGTDRWMRATLGLEGAQLTALFGTGSAGARPATWAPPGSVPGLNNGYAPIPDTGSQLYLVIFYLSVGGGGANTVTLRATVRVTT